MCQGPARSARWTACLYQCQFPTLNASPGRSQWTLAVATVEHFSERDGRPPGDRASVFGCDRVLDLYAVSDRLLVYKLPLHAAEVGKMPPSYP